MHIARVTQPCSPNLRAAPHSGLVLPRPLLVLLALLAPWGILCMPPKDILNDLLDTWTKQLCCNLREVCVDQGVYVLYHPKDDPRMGGELPKCFPEYRTNHFITDVMGASDVWGLQFGTPGPLLRPNTTGEESEDLRNPHFSKLTKPVVMMTHFDRIFAEFLRRNLAHVYAFHDIGNITSDNLLVLGNGGGMKLEKMHQQLLAPFTAHNVTTLSHLSSRLPHDTPEDYTVERKHVRCFSALRVCSFRHRSGAPALTQYFEMGQYIVRYYKSDIERLQAKLPPDMRDPSVFKVVVVARKKTGVRNILNRKELLDWCNSFVPTYSSQPGSLPSPLKRTYCTLYIPGKDVREDIAIAHTADVMVGLHGSGLYNAFFMRPGCSIVEIRPYQFSTEWADGYLRSDLTWSGRGVFWWGINVLNVSNAAPVVPLNAKMRIFPRDTNTRVDVRYLRVLFDRIISTANDKALYTGAVDEHRECVNDTDLLPQQPKVALLQYNRLRQ